ncbi:MAG: hypothetical protein O7B79_01550 [SAR324 cluster bacterium]|nr:hypothetical protein [SAR324 cluster bacterium]
MKRLIITISMVLLIAGLGGVSYAEESAGGEKKSATPEAGILLVDESVLSRIGADGATVKFAKDARVRVAVLDASLRAALRTYLTAGGDVSSEPGSEPKAKSADPVYITHDVSF